MAAPGNWAEWEKTAKAKKQSILDLIPKAWHMKDPIPSVAEERDVTRLPRQYLTETEIKITETDAEGLQSMIKTGEWKAEEVVRAFAHRASLAHQLVNCLAEVFFDAAIEDAKKLDAYFEKHGSVIGPLHGIPVSLKDQVHVKGVETAMGYTGWIGTFQGKTGTGKEKVFESEIARELRNLGAVLYCKTNVPISLMCGETVNNVIGYTNNPKNRHLSSGGSSGGEGALIAMHGSPLGFGTDIGGSIRIPSAFCGQYGLKPSSGRFPYEGMANSMDGQNTILSVVGPMSSSVGGLRLALSSMLKQEPWLHDPMVHEIPWRHDLDTETRANGKGLTFGILRHDSIVTPYPPVARAIEMIVQALKSAGNKMIDWKPPHHGEGTTAVTRSYYYDGGADILGDMKLSGESFPPQLEDSYGSDESPARDATYIAANNRAKREFQKKYMDYWNSTAELTGTGHPVDAFIMPVAPFPSPIPETYDYYGYTHLANALDYPSVVIPVTTVDKSVDTAPADFKPMSDSDESMKNYDPEIFDGAYVGVQIMGRRLQEEKVIAVAEYVDRLLGGPLDRRSPQVSAPSQKARRNPEEHL